MQNWKGSIFEVLSHKSPEFSTQTPNFSITPQTAKQLKKILLRRRSRKIRVDVSEQFFGRSSRMKDCSGKLIPNFHGSPVSGCDRARRRGTNFTDTFLLRRGNTRVNKTARFSRVSRHGRQRMQSEIGQTSFRLDVPRFTAASLLPRLQWVADYRGKRMLVEEAAAENGNESEVNSFRLHVSVARSNRDLFAVS